MSPVTKWQKPPASLLHTLLTMAPHPSKWKTPPSSFIRDASHDSLLWIHLRDRGKIRKKNDAVLLMMLDGDYFLGTNPCTSDQLQWFCIKWPPAFRQERWKQKLIKYITANRRVNYSSFLQYKLNGANVLYVLYGCFMLLSLIVQNSDDLLEVL